MSGWIPLLRRGTLMVFLCSSPFRGTWENGFSVCGMETSSCPAEGKASHISYKGKAFASQLCSWIKPSGDSLAFSIQ